MRARMEEGVVARWLLGDWGVGRFGDLGVVSEFPEMGVLRGGSFALGCVGGGGGYVQVTE